MTVSELIKILQEYEPTVPVFLLADPAQGYMSADFVKRLPRVAMEGTITPVVIIETNVHSGAA